MYLKCYFVLRRLFKPKSLMTIHVTSLTHFLTNLLTHLLILVANEVKIAEIESKYTEFSCVPSLPTHLGGDFVEPISDELLQREVPHLLTHLLTYSLTH